MNKTALLFPGQGSQYVGMGLDLFERYPQVRELYRQADELLGFSVSQACFEGPIERLTQTEVLQPALLVTSLAAWQCMQQAGLSADAATGLSLGEYTALVAAHSVTFAQALPLVRVRGRLMQETVPQGAGGMLALLGVGEEQANALCAAASREGSVAPANYNCPGQVVLAGVVPALEEAARLAPDFGAKKAVRLPVSAPFHSPLLESAGDKLWPLLQQVRWMLPRMPVASNVDGRIYEQAREIPEHLRRQVSHPVRFEDCVRTLWGIGCRRFVEVGPGKALGGFLKRIVPEASYLHVENQASLEQALDLWGEV